MFNVNQLIPQCVKLKHWIPIKKCPGIAPNKVFKEYFRHEFENKLRLYQDGDGFRRMKKVGKEMAKDITSAKKGKVFILQ